MDEIDRDEMVRKAREMGQRVVLISELIEGLKAAAGKMSMQNENRRLLFNSAYALLQMGERIGELEEELAQFRSNNVN